MRVLWLFVFLACFCGGACESQTSKKHFGEALRNVIEASRKLLQYLKQNQREMIVDSIFGVRVMQGALHKLLNNIERGGLKTHRIRSLELEIKHLFIHAGAIANKSLAFAYEANQEYFETVGFTAQTEWNVIRDFRPLDRTLKIPQIKTEKDLGLGSEPELELDECFMALIGRENKKIRPCTVSTKCWKLIFVAGSKDYFLTHQLLYFMLAVKRGCTQVINNLLKKSKFYGGINQFFASRCAFMYPQMKSQEAKVFVSVNQSLGDMDLYLEQCVVGSMLGYEEFLSLRQLQQILAWQHPKGCFGFHGDIIRKPEDEYEDEDTWETKTTMRKLKVAKTLKDGCELHISGVAVGLLGMYILWLYDIMGTGTQSEHDMKADKFDTWIKYSTVIVILALVVYIMSKRRLRYRVISLLRIM
ncbi:UPF0764 protein C16orf89 homolog [Nematostella vectensis]|uniref:UPF0764 protein C16orf89 homolog n=1 Tax=Nematostella vectensis TaxID=45351 RepID=UPI002077874A|nr:UPF0764 protein C16orf89 homolog [Nematostella vectensis]